MVYKGINYDVGTNYAPGFLSREVWSEELMLSEINVIAHELQCNSIEIYGSDIPRLIACGKAALEEGLNVWLQPRLIDANPHERLEHLSELAKEAEKLRIKYKRVTLNVGCEVSIFMSGIIPGATYAQRAAKLLYLWPFLGLFNKKINKHLKEACAIARYSFKGDITYGSGIWEGVDWTDFDIIGLNYYRESTNYKSYASDLRNFHRYKKPIVITEFGCCTYKGADKKGGSGDGIVDWRNVLRPKLKHDRFIRSEAVQANYIKELFSIFGAEGIYGAFVFQFIEPSYTYSKEPLYDLDMASFAIVKSFAKEFNYEAGYWEPKEAFGEIAKLYSEEL